MSDPILTGAQEGLLRSFGEMRRCIEGLPTDGLNWRPVGDETNSIAVLVTHSLHSTRSWLSVAVGEPLPARDRPSEFVETGQDAKAILALLDSMSGDCLALADPARAVDWSALRETAARPNPADSREVTAGWAVLHAVEHLREHVGQMMLTRQLWERAKDR